MRVLFFGGDEVSLYCLHCLVRNMVSKHGGLSFLNKNGGNKIDSAERFVQDRLQKYPLLQKSVCGSSVYFNTRNGVSTPIQSIFVICPPGERNLLRRYCEDIVNLPVYSPPDPLTLRGFWGEPHTTSTTGKNATDTAKITPTIPPDWLEKMRTSFSRQKNEMYEGQLSSFGETTTSARKSAPVRENAVDVALVVSFRYLFPIQFLRNFYPVPFINAHPSLLPRFRGPSPIHATLLHGERVGGATLITIPYNRATNDRTSVDTGDILLQKQIDIPSSEMLREYFSRVVHLTAECIVDALCQGQNHLNSLLACAQSQARPTSHVGAVPAAPKISKASGLLSLCKSNAHVVYNQWRALHMERGKASCNFHREFSPSNAILKRKREKGCPEGQLKTVTPVTGVHCVFNSLQCIYSHSDNTTRSCDLFNSRLPETLREELSNITKYITLIETISQNAEAVSGTSNFPAVYCSRSHTLIQSKELLSGMQSNGERISEPISIRPGTVYLSHHKQEVMENKVPSVNGVCTSEHASRLLLLLCADATWVAVTSLTLSKGTPHKDPVSTFAPGIGLKPGVLYPGIFQNAAD